MYGRTIYQVNLINTRTGMYYNSASLWFDTMDEAKEYILKNDLIWTIEDITYWNSATNGNTFPN